VFIVKLRYFAFLLKIVQHTPFIRHHPFLQVGSFWIRNIRPSY